MSTCQRLSCYELGQEAEATGNETPGNCTLGEGPGPSDVVPEESQAMQDYNADYSGIDTDDGPVVYGVSPVGSEDGEPSDDEPRVCRGF